MKILNRVMVAVIALLCIAAGVAKIIQAPEEVAFLQGFGLSINGIVAFGLLQVLAGVFITPPKTRLYGALLASFTFVVSTVFILMSGNVTFALVSMIPIVLSGAIIKRALNITPMR